MSFTVTVTRQGQISIPAALRRKFALSDGRNLVLEDTADGRIMMNPVPDFLELAGSLKKYAKNSRGKTFRQMREDFENYLAARHLGKKLL